MSKDFKKLMNEFNSIRQQLNETYMFNGEDDSYGDEDAMMRDRQENDMYQDDDTDEKVMHMQDVIRHEPIIAKIRETAIEGLKKYSDDPTSEIYEFMKKVFLSADKVLTGNGKS